jgi:PPE-repeat protein
MSLKRLFSRSKILMETKGEVVKGYKAFDKDLKCRDYQFKVGDIYTHKGEFKLCETGFHFCLKPADVFNYYSFAPETRVCEIEALGDVAGEGDKRVTNKIKILREIPKLELFELVNQGKENTGLTNSGDRNSGHYNSGDYNSGNYNSGIYNSGDCNSGSYNSGDHSSGDHNSGNRNSGDYNSGSYNSGDHNSGNRNSGDYNSGHYNSGDYNSGNYNSGDRNSGNYNSGDYNSGNYNSGDYNSGNYNSGDYNSGLFNTNEPNMRLFNKQTKLRRKDPRIQAVIGIGPKFKEWINFENMKPEEKAAWPKAETCGGYLKDIPYKEAWLNFWVNSTAETRKKFTSLPFFDNKIFQEITGIDVKKKY